MFRTMFITFNNMFKTIFILTVNMGILPYKSIHQQTEISACSTCSIYFWDVLSKYGSHYLSLSYPKKDMYLCHTF